MTPVKLTDNFEIRERRIENIPGEELNHFIYYKSNKLIHDNQFEAAVDKLGQWVYNVCVCKMEDVTLFNGYTWVGVHARSFDECDKWLKVLEQKLKEVGW